MKFKNPSYVEKWGNYLAKKGGGWYCYYCGIRLLRKRNINKPRKHKRKYPVAIATVDHKKPLAVGGADSPHNMVLCCLECNNEKGELDDRTYIQLKQLERKMMKSARV